jgi:V-type H+-transporting ATPase subunit H
VKEIPSFVSALLQHPNPYNPFLPLLKQSTNPEEPIPLLTSAVLSSLISNSLASNPKQSGPIDEALPRLYAYLSALARSSDAGLQDIAVQEYSSLLRTQKSRQLFWKQRSDTLEPLLDILRSAIGTSRDGDSTVVSGGTSIRSVTEGLAGGVGIQLLYHVLLVIWQLSFEGALVGNTLNE